MDQRKVSFEDKVTNFISKNLRNIVGGLLVLVIGWGAFAIFGFYQMKQEKAAQNELFAIADGLEKKQQELMADEASKNDVKVTKKGEKKASPPVPKTLEKTPETLVKNYGSFVEQFQTFIGSHKGTKASYVAAIELADLYLDHKDAKKAVEVLKPVAKEPSSSELFYGLLQSQLGLALSDAGDCAEAVKVFDDILKVEAQKPFHSQSLLRKGACLVTMNQPDEAKGVFEKARTEFPDSFTGEMAQGYERLVELKKGAK